MCLLKSLVRCSAVITLVSRQKLNSVFIFQPLRFPVFLYFFSSLSSVKSYLHMKFYRKIHYLTREFHVKLHAKTDIARIAKRWVRYRSALQKAISKSTVRTVIANRKQVSRTRLTLRQLFLYLVLVFTFVFKPFYV